MNLHIAHTELKTRTAEVRPATLAVETLLVVSFSYLLVGIFS